MIRIKTAITAAVVATTLFACKNTKNKEAQVEEHQEVKPKTTKDSADLEKLRYADNLEGNAIEKPQLPENYEIDWDTIAADPKLQRDLKNWEEFNSVSASINALSLKEIPQEKFTDFITGLKVTVGNLQNTIPQALATEEVHANSKELGEQVSDLEALTGKQEPDEKHISKKVEELIATYGDLKKALAEALVQKDK